MITAKHVQGVIKKLLVSSAIPRSRTHTSQYLSKLLSIRFLNFVTDDYILLIHNSASFAIVVNRLDNKSFAQPFEVGIVVYVTIGQHVFKD